MTSSRSVAAVLVGFLVPSMLIMTGASGAPATSTTTPTTYHQAASGRTVQVKKGHVIRISLTTSTDGGYGWAVVRGRHSTKFTILSRKVVHATSSTVNGVPLVGGTSQTIWTIKGIARGYSTFKAVERRPWDKDHVIKRFTLHLHVTRP
jgi:predicted secreted protein